MEPISTEEMLRILGRNPTGLQKVEMSRDGIFLHVAEGTYPLSSAQADALFETMFGRSSR